MLFQCTDSQERKLKPAQSLKCTAAETVNAGVFSEHCVMDKRKLRKSGNMQRQQGGKVFCKNTSKSMI